jgi:hypothetical protein
MVAQYPAEIADEIRNIHEEINGGDRLESQLLAMMVKYYSTAEIMALARFLESPEAQSALQKQQLVLAESMEFGAKEFVRVFNERHPGANLEVVQPPALTNNTIESGNP